MKNKFLIFGIVLISSCCSNEESKSKVVDKNFSFPFLQFYVDSSSYYYMKAIEGIQRGEKVRLIEDRYVGKIIYFHKKLNGAFDSITTEYMSGKISQSKYDEIRNSLFLDSVIKRSERLSQLGLDVELK